MKDSIVQEIIKKQEQNTYVAHYTSMETLHGLINGITMNKETPMMKFWASNIMALNDPSELFYGYSIIRKWLPKIEDELGISKDDRLSRIWSNNNIEKKNHPFFNNYLKDALPKQEMMPYIISFSHEIDNLAMYRMYGNDAAGVCIVLSYGLLKDDIKDNKHIYDVCYEEKIDDKCEYSPYDMLKCVYNLYINDLHKKKLNDNERIKLMLNHLVTYTLIISPYLKHEDYEYEKEIRYSKLCKLSDGVKFRISKNGNIIPYKEVEIPVRAINKIIIGPCTNFESAKFSIELEFKSKGIINMPTIEKSNKNYRAF